MNLYSLQPTQTAPPPPGGGQSTTQAPSASPGGQPGPQGGPGSMMVMLLAFLPVILFMWYTSRSQQKKQRELESKLKKGDRIVTQSGLVGKLVETGEGRHVKVEIAPGVKVQMLKTAIVGLDADDAGSSKPKDDSGAVAEKK